MEVLHCRLGAGNLSQGVLINYLRLHAQCMARSLSGKHLQCIMTAVLPQSRSERGGEAGGGGIVQRDGLHSFNTFQKSMLKGRFQLLCT